MTQLGHAAGGVLAYLTQTSGGIQIRDVRFTWRRTGSSLPGALICGLFGTWYVVAGTATQAAF